MFKINLLIFYNNCYFLLRFNKPISINVIKLMIRKLLHRVFIPLLPKKICPSLYFHFQKDFVMHRKRSDTSYTCLSLYKSRYPSRDVWCFNHKVLYMSKGVRMRSVLSWYIVSRVDRSCVASASYILAKRANCRVRIQNQKDYAEHGLCCVH